LRLLLAIALGGGSLSAHEPRQLHFNFATGEIPQQEIATVIRSVLEIRSLQVDPASRQMNGTGSPQLDAGLDGCSISWTGPLLPNVPVNP
jgi:hypothetical protein